MMLWIILVIQSVSLVFDRKKERWESYLHGCIGYDQALVLDVADTLLQIDLSLIESRIQALWPSMLNVSIGMRMWMSIDTEPSH